MAMDHTASMIHVEPVLGDRISLVDAAWALGIHPQSLRRLILQEVVPATKAFGKYVLQRPVLEMLVQNYDPRPGNKPTPMLL